MLLLQVSKAHFPNTQLGCATLFPPVHFPPKRPNTHTKKSQSSRNKPSSFWKCKTNKIVHNSAKPKSSSEPQGVVNPTTYFAPNSFTKSPPKTDKQKQEDPLKTRSLCSVTNNWKKVKKLATTTALESGLLVSYKKKPIENPPDWLDWLQIKKKLMDLKKKRQQLALKLSLWFVMVCHTSQTDIGPKTEIYPVSQACYFLYQAWKLSEKEENKFAHKAIPKNKTNCCNCHTTKPPKKDNPNSKLLIQHHHHHPSQHPIQHHQLMIKIISPKMKKRPPKERAHSIKSLPSQSYHDRGKSSFAKKRRTKTEQNKTIHQESLHHH